MTQYWNNAHFAASPKNVPYTLPKPSTFGAKHSGQESRSFTSSHSFFDFTDAWRERIRQSDRRPDDVVRTNSQLEVSDISRFLQNPTGPTNAWPVASQGFSTRRSWLDGNDIFSSSSPTSEVSDPSNTRASQSISPRTSIGSQDWEFCPTWSLNNAAKDFVPTKKAETAGECFSFSSQSQAMSNNPWNAPRAVVAPPRLDAGHGHWNGSSGTTHEPRGPSPFNHKTELYKTELCRNWEEKGFCYYGECVSPCFQLIPIMEMLTRRFVIRSNSRCQFAHGEHDLRPIQRDPRWKTRQCKAFKEYAALWRTYNPWFLSLRLFPSFRLSCAARNGSCHFAKRCW
uniref:C3H1-type domain-containing protein n=1 Tax=Kalmanozyma brasiliensis (strain GHG001) TaxID=1365824 RepID=V5GNT2_KALBG